jgi:hypothetical protein
MNTAILLIGFNRAERLAEVHAAAVTHCAALPIIVHVDGAGPESKYFKDNNLVKEMVIAWHEDARISAYKFQSRNLGCKYGPPAAISWGFEHYESLIILEDDCVPDGTFFPYCVELLQRYAHDLRVGSIAGDNAYSLDMKCIPYSYIFISYPRIWGWATWRDRWAAYDPDRKLEKIVESHYGYQPRLAISRREEVRLRSALNAIESGIVSNWDTQWWSCFASNNWLCIQPTANLIRNTGFGEGATHTTNNKSPFGRLQSGQLQFPLKHPLFVRAEREVDCALAAQYGIVKRFLRLLGRLRS